MKRHNILKLLFQFKIYYKHSYINLLKFNLTFFFHFAIFNLFYMNRTETELFQNTYFQHGEKYVYIYI